MGLDQYAKIRNPKTNEVQEIAYWRKHNALHGWMEDLWESKDRPDEREDDSSFNCIPLELTMEDLEKLENDLIAEDLPETTGLFFGSDSRLDEHKMVETFKFLIKARKAIENGWQVAYDSWW